MEISPLVRPVGLGQRAGGIDPVLEVLGHAREAARVHGLCCLQQAGFFFAHRHHANVLSRTGDDHDVLVSKLSAREGGLSLRQFLQLARDAHPFGGRAA